MAERDHFLPYRELAAAIVHKTLSGPPLLAIEFCRSDIGRLWLAWLRLRPDWVIAQLKADLRSHGAAGERRPCPPAADRFFGEGRGFAGRESRVSTGSEP